ncbi:MAG TPA: bifunctional precorrin-2 dehydrogenase/sirohydrochlorin ferrochelatase [Caulobacteraceae bacterium]
MDSFPAFFPLAGRRVVIVGEGEHADGKARLFMGSPAEVDRIDDGRALDPETYRGAVLAFIASGDAAFDELAAQAAREAGVPVNVVDRPPLCDFFTPALVDRGQVVAAVGTGGASPVLAQVLKQELEGAIPEGSGRVAALLQDFRKAVQAAFPDLGERRNFVLGVLQGPAAAAAMEGRMDEARRLMAEAVAGVSPPG